MSDSNSSSESRTTTNQADNRVVLGNDALQIGAFGSYAYDASRKTSNAFNVQDSSSRDSSQHWTDLSSRDYSDRSTRTTSSNTSFQVNDSSSRDSSDRRTFSDSRDQSDRSTYTVSNTGTDAARIVDLNNGLLHAVNSSNGDTVRLLTAMGTDGIRTQAQAATNLFATGSAEASKAWGHTIDQASTVIDKLLQSASSTITGAQTVARDAISSYQPTDNKTADTTMKYALLAIAGVAAILILKKG